MLIARRADTKARTDFATWKMMAKLNGASALPAEAQNFLASYKALLDKTTEPEATEATINLMYRTYYAEMGGHGTPPDIRAHLKEPVTGNVTAESVGRLVEIPFTEGFSFRIVNGHTDSMMLPQLTYKGKTIVFMADLLPSAAHLPIPYVMAYDMFPLTSLREKKDFLEEAVAGDYMLFFEHDPIHECCSLQKTEKGIRAKEFFKLKEL